MAGPDLLSVLFAPVVSSASGLIGVAIGGFIASRNQKQERRHHRDQLVEFYAPLLGWGIRCKVNGIPG